MQRVLIFFLFSFLFISCKSQQKEKKVAPVIVNNFHFNPLSESAKEGYAQAIAPLYAKYLLQKGFNGSILMAKNGEIVFEDYHGLYNLKTKESITSSTPFHLASISKTFTGMAILHLWEQGKISLDDSVQHFFPAFPYHNITIKELLSHRSGLPNYVYFMNDKKVEIVKKRNKKGRLITVTREIKSPAILPKGFATNNDMLQFMIDKNPPVLSLPDKGFHYCNTNFALLALIAEKITGEPFPQFMKDSVFTPLGMKNSFIFNIADTNAYIPSYYHNGNPFKLEKLDCIYGDKNVYSTVRDLFLWDKALYEGTFVKKETLEMAFKPYSLEKRSKHNYGLGWRMLIDPNEGTVIYHNGWWHGNRTVFTRVVNDTATLIILDNKDNKSVYNARRITSVFTGRADTTKLEE